MRYVVSQSLGVFFAIPVSPPWTPSTTIYCTFVQLSRQKTPVWLICKDGSGDAPTIQAGIDSAADGDSVVLEGGT